MDDVVGYMRRPQTRVGADAVPAGAQLHTWGEGKSWRGIHNREMVAVLWHGIWHAEGKIRRGICTGETMALRAGTQLNSGSLILVST